MEQLLYSVLALAAGVGLFLRQHLTRVQQQRVITVWWLCLLMLGLLTVAIIVLPLGPTLEWSVVGMMGCLATVIAGGMPIIWDAIFIHPLRQRSDRILLTRLLNIDSAQNDTASETLFPHESAILLLGGAFVLFIASLPIYAAYGAVRCSVGCLGMACVLTGVSNILEQRMPVLARWMRYVIIWLLYPLCILFMGWYLLQGVVAR